MTLAEQIYEVVKTLLTYQANEVLDFIYFLQAKLERENSDVLAEEQGILAWRNQKIPVSTDYLQQLRETGRP
ncbi:MAG: hypothetical protein HC877_17215 [Thioploca sp.]|nr:hypothetical protein [Thioploca sp.]